MSQRELKILQRLLRQQGVIRIIDLSQELGISSRTIKYDLANIKRFLEKHQITLHSKPGIGIWVDVEMSQAKEILQSFAKDEYELYFDQKMRIQEIIFLLFEEGGYVTAEKLSELLSCSRTTILNDMKVVIDILGDHLSIKKGQGYQLVGEEIQLRQMMEERMNKMFTDYDIYNIAQRMRLGTGYELSISVPYFQRYYPIIEPVILEIYKNKPKEVITLIIRCLISLVRVEAQQLVGTREISSEAQAYSSIYEAVNLPVYTHEVAYVSGTFKKMQIDVDIQLLTMNLIREVSQADNYPYYEEGTLYTNLLMHLAESLKAKVLENPFNQMIKTQYKTLFTAVKTSLNDHLPPSRVVEDSFVTYVVLHFLSVKKTREKQEKVKAVLVCASGRGAVKIIKKIIEAANTDIEVIQSCSLIEAQQVIERLQPDLVISVFPLESDVPVVIVEPIPTEKNLSAIKSKSREVQGQPYLEAVLGEPSHRAKELSLDILLLGMRIYHALGQMPNFQVEERMEFAFLSHILLFAHRSMFNEQYTQAAQPQTMDEGLAKEIRQVFEDLGVEISEGELEILKNYMK